MSGNGEYVTGGGEANKFFQSVQLKEYNAGEWQTWQPATGGFSVQVPHVPALLRDNNVGTDRMEYSAWDKQDGNSYLVMKVNLHNYSFLEEDSFELNLVDESYGYSTFIDKQLSRKFIKVNGYPALEAKYSHKDGSYSAARYIIRGPVYYAVIARYKKEDPNVRRFLESFSIQPFVYPAVKARTDTSLHYTVQSPVFPDPGKKDEAAGMEDIYRMAFEEMGGEGLWGSGDEKYSVISNDTTGEKILVTYTALPKYAYWKDSATFWKQNVDDTWNEDSSFVTRLDKRYDLPNGIKCREKQYTDTGSSRLLMVKTWYKEGHLFNIATLTDTVSRPSSFLQNFFASFTPADTLKGQSVFTRRTHQVVAELFSKDSLTARKAARAIFLVHFDSTDVPLLNQTIDSLNWDHTEYLRTKKHLVGWLGRFKDNSVTTYLQALYWKIKDTADFQHAILNSLTSQRTQSSFKAFKDLILQEPPIDEGNSWNEDAVSVVPGWHTTIYPPLSGGARRYVDVAATAAGVGYDWYDLYDTLALTKTIFPDILQLMNIDDYESRVMNLLKVMVDSGFLKAADYESYFGKLYLDGKQLLKKQVAAEGKVKIERAGKKDKSGAAALFSLGDDDEEDQEVDQGNGALEQYAALLLPFRDKHPGVQSFFEQLMKTGDRRLLYNTFLLLLRNKQPVPDSLFVKYAKPDEYRSELYGDLEKLKMTAQFPAQYKTQLEMTRSLLVNGISRYEKMDTIVYLDKLPVTYKGRKGYVYFYKYKKMRDDISWQLASVGMQPEKADEVSVDDDEFTTREERKLETDIPVKEQLEKMLKEMVYAKRSSASEFYQARNFRLYKGYMSEMVKSRRYRD
ncbi:hypothetical protein D3H65_16500 [Paraflavitalea soli]|uniref:Uncharacterized protein n=1 Tax=Paraflavitalea soli TaxID=2315862 RepID=A0A3B7MYW1_9BACT|nr:hypothetical protein [Paraflavitalea soli]AXY75481.1 hypothetical protein D3H65_16500 [Paraflavitalea soli]